jgi:hypothetical protein
MWIFLEKKFRNQIRVQVNINKESCNKEEYPTENYFNAQARDCFAIRGGCKQVYSQCSYLKLFCIT